MQVHATCKSPFVPTMISTYKSFKVIVVGMFPLQSFMWLEMGMLLYLLCPKFLRVMTIIKLEECWRMGNKKAPKVCCHN